MTKNKKIKAYETIERNFFEEIQNLYRDANLKLAHSNEMMQKYDLAICDALHLIELESLSGPEMLSLMKKMKFLLKQRRRYKDQHTLTQQFLSNPRTPEQYMTVEIEKIQNKDREYTPRVFWKDNIKTNQEDFEKIIDLTKF